MVQNPAIRELARLDRVLSPQRDSPVAGRPLVNLSFAVDYALDGLEVPGYHVTNLAWHIVCAWLLFGVVRRTLALPAIAPARAAHASDLAMAVALVWGVHPLTTEVVDYLSQRTESMMACCLLLTMYAAIRSHGSPGRGWHALAIVACLAGTVCKETIAVAPLLVALYDRVFLYGSWREAARAPRVALPGPGRVVAGTCRSGDVGATGGGERARVRRVTLDVSAESGLDRGRLSSALDLAFGARRAVWLAGDADSGRRAAAGARPPRPARRDDGRADARPRARVSRGVALHLAGPGVEPAADRHRSRRRAADVRAAHGAGRAGGGGCGRRRAGARGTRGNSPGRRCRSWPAHRAPDG